MRTGWSLAATSLMFVGSLFLAISSQVHSVSALPATCSPGGGVGGAMADHVDLWNGTVNVPYYCSGPNVWSPFAAANLSAPPPIGNTTPNTGAFTTLQVGVADGSQGIGSGVVTNTDMTGQLTMSAGVNSYTFVGAYANHPECTASDQTNIAGVKVSYTGATAVNFQTSAASDVVSYICHYRN